MKITTWNIGIVWEDGTEEKIGDIPDWVANRVDEFLNELEEEYYPETEEENENL